MTSLIVKNLSFTSSPNTAPTPEKNFDRESWLESIQPYNTFFGGCTKVANLSRPIKTIATSNQTFAGLAAFVYHCWAKELPLELSPDLLFERVLSEFCELVLRNPELFRNLFTPAPPGNKMNIVTMTDREDHIDVDAVVGMLKTLVSKELFDVIVGTTFTTDNKMSILSRRIAFCNMAVPYYNFLSIVCGVPAIRFTGTAEDWAKLRIAIDTLHNLTLGKTDKLHGTITMWSAYLENFSKIVATIESIVSQKINPEEASDFVATIIRQDKNHRCICGATEYLLNGWIIQTYLFGYYKLSINKFKSAEIELHDLAADIHYIPYEHTDTGSMFFRAIGITSSEAKDGFMVAQRNEIVEEILDRQYYNSLSFQS